MEFGVAMGSNPQDGVSGDAVIIEEVGNKHLFGVVDGLGHGPLARHAAEVAVATVRENLTKPLTAILKACDAAMRGTRGAVMGLVLLDAAEGSLTYAGVGNTAILIPNWAGPALFSSSGIVGGNTGTIREHEGPYQPGQTIIMHTDGITTRLDLGRYTPSVLVDVQLLAEGIMREFRCPHDDAAVLVAR